MDTGDIGDSWAQPLGWEDPLEEEMVTHSSVLAWKIPWTEEPSGLQSMGLQRIRHDLAKDSHFHFHILKSGIAGSIKHNIVLSNCVCQGTLKK